MHIKRTEAFLSRIQALGAQGALVHTPSNIRWLSGYTGEGMLVIAEGLRAVVTDFRYTEQAEGQAPGYTVEMTTVERKAEAVAAELFKAAGVTTLAFEDDTVTVKGMDAIAKAMPALRFIPSGKACQDLRIIKDDTEIASIEKACAISCQAFEHMLGIIRPGMTELEVRFELENAMYRFGAEKLAFDTIVAAGANGSLPHAIPGNRRIQPGDMVTMDFGARVNGYCADITRTVAVGSISPEKRRVYDTVLTAQLAALEKMVPGMSCREVDATARRIIDEAGYPGRFGHGLGHSLGLDIHESPRCSVAATEKLAAGMLMTDEPGIYLPGECGCRIEDTVLITAEGPRRLTPATKELIIL